MKYSEEQIIEKLKEFKAAFISKNEKIKTLEVEVSELKEKLEATISEKNSLQKQLNAKSDTELIQMDARAKFDEELSKLIDEANVLIDQD